MKQFFFVLILILSSSILEAQVPAGFNYQAVIRNNDGEIFADQQVKMKFSILRDSKTGTAIYVETQSANTNQFGLVNLTIGDGTVLSGIFDPGGWGMHKHFLKVEIDPSGGDAFVHMGTSQLHSVPYAFHAQTVEEDQVEDADADPENELQELQLSGTVLGLSGSSKTVNLPSSGGGDNWGTQTVASDETLSGEGTFSSPLGVVVSEIPVSWEKITGKPTGFDDGIDDVADDDPDPTNEIQMLSISGTTLSLSEGGGSVELPTGTGGDNWGTQTVVTDETLTGLGIESNPLQIKNGGVTSAKILDGSILTNDLADFNVTGQKIANNAITTEKINAGAVTGIKIAQAGATNGQTLKWNGTSWTPGDDLTGSSLWEETPPYGIRYINGNVGIGQTPHRHKLTIYDDDNSQIGFYNSTSGTSGTDGFTIGTTPAGSPVWIWNWENSNMHFATNNTRRLDILANGTIIIWKNLNIMTDGGISNAILVNDDEALWYNGTYYSWGYGGDYNYFADPVTIKATNVPGYDLVVNGTAAKTGGGSWSNLSDIRLKNVLGNFTKGLNEIMALQPIRFTYKDGNPRQLSSEEEQVGFIAQEVQKIFPEAVNQCADGYLDFNIHTVNVALVNAVKELKAENELLKERLKKLEIIIGDLAEE